MVADIEGFFTKIQKSKCLDILREYTSDYKFLALLEKAIDVDLENAAKLWKYKDYFPYGDIGVAQGNCISPFLGNLLLSDFDRVMNDGDCRCIRYIDDILIVAPSGQAASSRFRKASRLLDALGMRFAPEKSSTAPVPVNQKFEYLGIEFFRGLMRPSPKSRTSIINRAKEAAVASLTAMKICSVEADFDQKLNIPRTLNRISGMAKGWAHHYAFCNDIRTIQSTDERICANFMSYLTKAEKISRGKKPSLAPVLLGYRGVSGVIFRPHAWPNNEAV